MAQNKDGKVTDFCSFYTLPSTVVQNPDYSELKAAYSYYNVATTMTLTELFHDMLVLAKQRDYDVFNALHIMENKPVFKVCACTMTVSVGLHVDSSHARTHARTHAHTHTRTHAHTHTRTHAHTHTHTLSR